MESHAAAIYTDDMWRSFFSQLVFWVISYYSSVSAFDAFVCAFCLLPNPFSELT